MARTMEISPVRKSSRPLPDHRQDWEWINENLDELRGKWVMMHEGVLVASDPNIRQLLNGISRDSYPDAMITYVPTKEEAKRIVL
ncbi:MAG TPA: hypothetical protein VN345_14485 [Blastocatellia bacterium]|nr:hypothetical protein [Blastocatellia bacterium]